MGSRAGGAVAVQGLLEVGDGLAAQGDIVCGNHIQAGWGIKARGDIRAACSIRAGETLQAEGEIAAGPGYGVFAGMNVQMDAWPDCAWVRASAQAAGPDQRLVGRADALGLGLSARPSAWATRPPGPPPRAMLAPFLTCASAPPCPLRSKP